MANVNANVNVIVNTKQAQSQIASFQSSINAFNKSVVTSSSAAVAQQAALNKALMDGAVASRMFTAKMVPVTSSVDNFNRSLERGKFSLGQYTRLATSQLPGMSRIFRKEFDTISRVAESNVRKLQTQFTAAGTAANGMNRAIALTPTGLDKMAASTAIANQRAMIFNKLMRDGSTSLLNWGKNTQWAGRQLMVGFTIPLTIFAGVAAKTFKDLEAQAINFKKVYGDIFTTETEVERNLDAVKELSVEMTKYGIAVKDTMALAGVAAQSGLRGADLMEATTQATRLAVLGQMEQAEAMKTVISMQTAFQQSNEELAESVDFLNIIENQTVLSLQDVAEAIPRVAPVIQGIGGDVKDLAVLLVAMREGGVSAAEGANALKNSLARLVSPTAGASSMAREFGINLEGIVERNAGEVLPMIRELAIAMKGLAGLDQQRLLSQIFGKFQYARIGALMNNIRDDSSQAARAMDLMGMSAEDLAKTAEKELSVVEESVSVKFTAAMEKAKVAIAPIGEIFLKAVTPLLEGISSIFDKFNSLPDNVKNAIGIVAGIIGGLVPVGLMVIGLLGNLLANGLKFVNFLRLLFARLTGTTAKFNDMAIAEQEAALASKSLEGGVQSLTGKLVMQAEAVQVLVGLLGRYAGAAAAASSAMPLGVGGGKAASGMSFANPFTRPAPDFRGLNKGEVGLPGTGNKDTIPAMLAPGESVITAAATKRFAPLLEAMNAGKLVLPGYARGVISVGDEGATRDVSVMVGGAEGSQKYASNLNNLRQEMERAIKYLVNGGMDLATAVETVATKVEQVQESMGETKGKNPQPKAISQRAVNEGLMAEGYIPAPVPGVGMKQVNIPGSFQMAHFGGSQTRTGAELRELATGTPGEEKVLQMLERKRQQIIQDSARHELDISPEEIQRKVDESIILVYDNRVLSLSRELNSAVGQSGSGKTVDAKLVRKDLVERGDVAHGELSRQMELAGSSPQEIKSAIASLTQEIQQGMSLIADGTQMTADEIDALAQQAYERVSQDREDVRRAYAEMSEITTFSDSTTSRASRGERSGFKSGAYVDNREGIFAGMEAARTGDFQYPLAGDFKIRPEVAAEFGMTVEELQNHYKQLLPQVQETFKNVGSDAVEQIIAFRPTLRREGEALVEETVGGISQAGDQQSARIQQEGGDIAENLEQGLRSGAAEVKQSGSELGSTAIAGIAEGAGNASASVKARQEGDNVGEGLEQGLRESAPEVRQAAEQLKNEVNLGLSGSPREQSERIKSMIGGGGSGGLPPSSRGGAAGSEGPRERKTPQQNAEDIKNQILSAVNETSSSAATFSGSVKRMFAETGNAFKVLPRLGFEVVRNFEEPMVEIKKMLGQIAAPYVNPIIAAYQTSKQKIISAASSVSDQITGAFKNAGNKIKNAYENVALNSQIAFESLKTVPAKIKSAYETAALRLMIALDAIKELPTTVKQKVQELQASLKESMPDLNRLKNKAFYGAQDIVGRGKEAFGKVKESLSGVRERFSASNQYAAESLREGSLRSAARSYVPDTAAAQIKSMTDGIKQSVENIKTKLSETSTKVLDSAKAAAAALREGDLKTAIKAMTPDKIVQAFSAAAKPFVDAGKFVADKLSSAATKVADVTRSIGQKLNEFGNKIVETGKNFANSVKVAGDALSSGDLKTALKALTPDKIQQAMGTARTRATEAVGRARERVGAIATNAKATGVTAYNALMARDVKTFIKALTPDRVQKAVSELAKRISDAGKEAYTKIVDGIKSAPGKIKESFNAFKTSLVQGARTIWTTTKSTLTEAFNNAKESLRSGFNDLKKSIMDTGRNIKTNLTTAFDNVKRDLKTEFNRIRDIFKTSSPQIKTAMAEASQGNKGAIRQAGAELARSLKEVGGAIREAGMAAAQSIGSKMGSGLGKATMAISGISMAASMVPGPLGEMAQKLMPLSMGLMAVSSLLPLFASGIGIAIVVIGLLAGSLIWLRKTVDDVAKSSAKVGANMGGMANRMEVFAQATGFKAPLERMKESLFRFSKEDKEVMTEFQDFFQTEGGGAFLKDLKEMSSKERYSALSSMIAQAIANGFDPEKARQFGQAVAFEINDAILAARINSDVKSGRLRSGSASALGLVKERQNATNFSPVEAGDSSVPLLGKISAESPLSRRLGTSGATNIWGEAAARVGLSAGAGAAVGAVTGAPALGVGAAPGAALGAIIGTLVSLPFAAKGAFDAMDQLNKSVEYVSKTFGSSIQVMKELANAEALLLEERRSGLIGGQEAVDQLAAIRAAEEEQVQRLMLAIQNSVDAGATQQAISDQLIMGGFEGDQAGAVSRAVDRDTVAQKVFGEAYSDIDEQQKEIVARIIAQTLSGMTPENAADKIADIESQYARIAELLVKAAEDGLSQADIRLELEKLQVGDWAQDALGESPEVKAGGEDPRVANIMAQKELMDKLGLSIDQVTTGLSSVPSLDLANEIASDEEKLEDFIETLHNLQDPDLANIPIDIAVDYIYGQGLSPKEFKRQMGDISTVFGDNTGKMIEHAKKSGIAIRNFADWGKNLKELPQEAITRIGIDMDDPESIEKFGPFAESIEKYWPILENLNKEIDMSAYIEYLTLENGKEVTPKQAVERTKTLNRAFKALEGAKTIEARKKALFDLETLKDGQKVSPEEFNNTWDSLIAEFGTQRIMNLPTDQLKKAIAISFSLEASKKQLEALEKTRAAAEGLTGEDRKFLGRLDAQIGVLRAAIGASEIELQGTVNFKSRDTGGSKGGGGGGGGKNFIEQMKENIKNLEGMTKLVTSAIAGKSPAFKGFIAGPFAPEFVEYLRSQGEEAVKQLGNNAKKFKETYMLFLKEKALELKMNLALEKQGYKQELKMSRQRQAFMSGLGGSTAQRDSIAGRFGDENMNTFLQLDSMTRAQRKAQGLQETYKELKKNIDLLAKQAPRMVAIQQMESLEGSVKSTKESFQLFNTLIAQGFSPTFAQKLIDQGVGLELLGDKSKGAQEKLAGLVAEVRNFEGIESGQNVLMNIASGREDLLSTFRIMAMFPGATKETIDAMKSLGVTAGSTAETMKTAFSGVKTAAAIAKLSMDAFSKNSMMIDASVSAIQRQIERINRIEVRPLEQQIKTIESAIKAVDNLIKGIQKTIKPIEKEIKNFEKIIKGLEKEIKVYDKQIKDLEKTIKPLEKENEALREIEKEINDEFAKREKSLDQIESINSRIAAQQKSQLSMSQAIAEGDIYAVAAAIQQYRAEQAQMNAEQTRQSLQEGNQLRISEITKKIEENEKQIKLTSEQIESIQERIEAIQERIEGIQEKIETRTERIAELNDEIADLQEKIADEQERIATLQESIEKSKEKQLALEEKIYKLQLLRSMLDTAKAIREAVSEGDAELVKLLQAEQRLNMEMAKGENFADLGINASPILGMANESVDVSRVSEAITNGIEAAFLVALAKMGIVTGSWVEQGQKGAEAFKAIFEQLSNLSKENLAKLPGSIQGFLGAIRDKTIEFPATAEALSAALVAYGVSGNDILQAMMAAEGLGIVKTVDLVGETKKGEVDAQTQSGKKQIDKEANEIGKSAANLSKKVAAAEKEFEKGNITFRQAAIRILGAMAEAISSSAISKVDTGGFNNALKTISEALQSTISEFSTTLSGTLDSILLIGSKFKENVVAIEEVTDSFSGVMVTVSEKFGKILENVGNEFGVIGAGFNAKFGELMQSLVNSFGESIKTEFGKIVSSLQTFTNEGTGLPLVLSTILNSLSNFADAINNSVSVLNTFAGAAVAAIQREQTLAIAAIAREKDSALGAISSAKTTNKYAGGMIKGYAMGGKIKGYPMGGKIPYAIGGVAGDGGRDSVNAMLTPGEFVVRKPMVEKYGQALLESINQGSFAMPKYNMPSSTPVNIQAVTNTANINAPVYNNYDMDFAIHGTNSSADEIANKVMFKIKQVQDQGIRGNRGY